MQRSFALIIVLSLAGLIACMPVPTPAPSTPTPAARRIVDTGPDSVPWLVWSPDGSQLAWLGKQGNLRVWIFAGN